MATDFNSIPLIDISDLVAKSDEPNMAEDQSVIEVVRLLDKACREVGFFYVKGHGIYDSLIMEIRATVHQFFNLPLDEKMKIKISATSGYRGYQRIRENITGGIPDMHEAIDYYTEVKGEMYGALAKPLEGSNKWPVDPPHFQQLVEEYLTLCKDLSRKIMRGFALALGGLPDLFEGDIAGDPFWIFRMIGYPNLSYDNSPNSNIGCGAHTDYGLLSLLNQDDHVTALQVRNLSGEWISVVPIPGTFVCNIGDMLKLLSNGLYESTMHRVINESPAYRVCVGYFYEPNFETELRPLDICVPKSGGTKKFEGAIYGKHLVTKLLKTFATLED